MRLDWDKVRWTYLRGSDTLSHSSWICFFWLPLGHSSRFHPVPDILSCHIFSVSSCPPASQPHLPSDFTIPPLYMSREQSCPNHSTWSVPLMISDFPLTPNDTFSAPVISKPHIVAGLSSISYILLTQIWNPSPPAPPCFVLLLQTFAPLFPRAYLHLSTSYFAYMSWCHLQLFPWSLLPDLIYHPACHACKQ